MKEEGERFWDEERNLWAVYDHLGSINGRHRSDGFAGIMGTFALSSLRFRRTCARGILWFRWLQLHFFLLLLGQFIDFRRRSLLVRDRLGIFPMTAFLLVGTFPTAAVRRSAFLNETIPTKLDAQVALEAG